MAATVAPAAAAPSVSGAAGYSSRRASAGGQAADAVVVASPLSSWRRPLPAGGGSRAGHCRTPPVPGHGVPVLPSSGAVGPSAMDAAGSSSHRASASGEAADAVVVAGPSSSWRRPLPAGGRSRAGHSCAPAVPVHGVRVRPCPCAVGVSQAAAPAPSGAPSASLCVKK